MISLIWAMDEQRLIGADNQMPWHLPADMTWFRKHTLGKSVLMGRKTFDSIGKPLPKRRNIILSRQTNLDIQGCDVIHHLDEIIPQFEDDELMVMGGSEIYTLAFPLAQRLYCTNIQHTFHGDAWFPPLDLTSWRLIHQEQHQADEKNTYDYRFEIYERSEQTS